MHENKSQRVTRVQRIAHEIITNLREWTVTSFLRNGMECERISQVAKRRGTEIVLIAWEQSQEKGITVRPVVTVLWHLRLQVASSTSSFDLIALAVWKSHRVMFLTIVWKNPHPTLFSFTIFWSGVCMCRSDSEKGYSELIRGSTVCRSGQFKRVEF